MYGGVGLCLFPFYVTLSADTLCTHKILNQLKRWMVISKLLYLENIREERTSEKNHLRSFLHRIDVSEDRLALCWETNNPRSGRLTPIGLFLFHPGSSVGWVSLQVIPLCCDSGIEDASSCIFIIPKQGLHGLHGKTKMGKSQRYVVVFFCLYHLEVTNFTSTHISVQN